MIKEETMAPSIVFEYINALSNSLDREVSLGDAAVMILCFLSVVYSVSLAIFKAATLETENIHESILSAMKSLIIGIGALYLEEHMNKLGVPMRYVNVAKVMALFSSHIKTDRGIFIYRMLFYIPLSSY
jgi:hypothetical protein